MPYIEDVAGKKYRATAIEAVLSQSKVGNAMIKVNFQLLDPPHIGLTWNGMLHNEKSTTRTLDTLRLCGWKGDDLSDVAFSPENEVSLSLKNEEYEGKQHTRVQWVNAKGDGSGFKLKDTLSPAEKVAIASRLKGAVLAHKAKGNTASGGSDIPFDALRF